MSSRTCIWGNCPGQLQSNLQILGGLQSQMSGEQDALNRAKQQNVYLESLLGQYHSVQQVAQAARQHSYGPASA